MKPSPKVDYSDDPAEYLSPAWDHALDHMHALQMKRGKGFKHPMAEKFDYAAWGLSVLTGPSVDTMAAAHNWGAFPFAEWGERFFLAWNSNDVAFFEDLARVIKIDAGLHKKKRSEVMRARVIELAFDLSVRLKRDATLDEVRLECESQGLHTEHWGKMFRDCLLGFLKGPKRGAPKKAKKTTFAKK